jgi:hypothetical protein
MMHPYLWGGIPFQEPGPFKYTFLYVLFNMLIIGAAATLSGLMTTAKECRKISLWTAVVNARWANLFALLAMLILALVPFIKSPALAVLSWVPYANQIVTGLYMSVLVLIGGMIGNGYSRRDVCYKQ